MAKDFDIRGQKIPIGLSIGAAVYPSDGADIDALLANADAALYRAKAERAAYACASSIPRWTGVCASAIALQHDLRSAIGHGELSSHYQPQAKIDGEVFGFEALLRWQHPEARLACSPSTFIPARRAERHDRRDRRMDAARGLPRGRLLDRSRCRSASIYRRSSSATAISPALVHAILLETGLAPRRLELEITEGVLINDPPRALSILRRLKALGVKIAMDDFGTGYASLSSLQSFPFDKIKIDRTFVAGVDINGQSEAIVRAVIGLGKALNIPVIAEGVETEGERMFLMREGCAEIQGYLIGYPRPIESYAGLTSGLDVGERAMVS